MQQATVEHPSSVFRAINTQLEKLGYSLVWQDTGNADIIIEDYPNRPITDFFTLRYIALPVGYANPAGAGRLAHYYFEAPSVLTGKLEGSDIRAELDSLESKLATFCEQHDLVGHPKQVLPLLQVLHGNVERTRRCLKARIHPKWLADALAFGIDFSEAVELKDVPYHTLYKLFA